MDDLRDGSIFEFEGACCSVAAKGGESRRGNHAVISPHHAYTIGIDLKLPAFLAFTCGSSRGHGYRWGCRHFNWCCWCGGCTHRWRRTCTYRGGRHGRFFICRHNSRSDAWGRRSKWVIGRHLVRCGASRCRWLWRSTRGQRSQGCLGLGSGWRSCCLRQCTMAYHGCESGQSKALSGHGVYQGRGGRPAFARAALRRAVRSRTKSSPARRCPVPADAGAGALALAAPGAGEPGAGAPTAATAGAGATGRAWTSLSTLVSAPRTNVTLRLSISFSVQAPIFAPMGTWRGLPSTRTMMPPPSSPAKTP